MDINKITEEIDQLCKSETLRKEDIEHITDQIECFEDVRMLLPYIRKTHLALEETIKQCGERIALFNDSKKTWKKNDEQLMTILQAIIGKVSLRKHTDGDLKLTTATRTVLEIADEDSLMQTIENTPEMTGLKAVLPPWVKLSLTIDKVAMKNWINGNSPEAAIFMVNNCANVKLTNKVTVSLK